MLQKIDLSGKTALITGASSGIGLATAQRLAEYGASVVLASRSQQKISEEARTLRDAGHHAWSVVCDVTSYSSVQAAADFAVSHAGGIDILVNNAGIIDPMAPLAESDPEEWARAVDVNYKGVYYGMRVAIPIMLENGGGTIINLSSGAATGILHGWSHYCSSKAAAKKLTEVANKELENSNVTVVGLSPGTVATPMMEQIRDAKINPVSDLDWSVHIPPQWVAEAIVFLSGEDGQKYAGTDFSLKTNEGRQAVGLPPVN